MRAQPHPRRLERHLRLVHGPARRSWPRGRSLGLAGFLLLAAAAAFWPGMGAQILGPPDPTIAGVARVIDGDTLEIAGQRIRLHGVDAPERDQSCKDARGRRWACGREAAQELRALAGHRFTACYRQDVDRYGRLVARCEVGGRDVANELARQGLAVAYLRYSWAYALPQIEAWADARGIWAGEFVSPEDWRRRRG